MNVKRYILLFNLLLLLGIQYLHAQNNFVINQGDSTWVTCANPCDSFTATYFDQKATDNYIYGVIPYATSTLPAPNILSLGDDNFSGAIPLGFDFCFYNQVYTHAYISANGVISFNNAYSYGASSFDTKTAIPYYNSTFADNAIYGPFMDLKPSQGGVIQYQTIGTSPNRKFVVQYNALKLFGGTCANTTSSFEIVLHELSNFIDVQITDKVTCDTDTSNYLNFATVAIQSPAATSYTFVNGKNASIWSANNLGYRFSPNGVSSSTSITWYDAAAVFPALSTNPNGVNVCGGPFPRTIIGKISYTCPPITLSDTIIMYQNGLTLDSLVSTPGTCKNSTNGTITAYGTSLSTPLQYSINNQAFVSTNVFTNVNVGGHLIKIKDANGCIDFDSVDVNALSYLDASTDVIGEGSCDPTLFIGSAAVIASLGVLPYTYLWNNGATTDTIYNLSGDSTYSCIVTDSLGCVVNTTVYVPTFQLTVITDSIKDVECPLQDGYIEIHATGGTAPYTYVWTTGQTGNILNNLAAGNYNVTVTDSVGCFKTTTIIVNADSLPIIGGTYTDNICYFSNGTVTTAITSGTPPYTYLWNTGSTSPNLTGLDSGIYILTVADSKGCSSIGFFTIKDTFRMQTSHVSTPTKCGLNNGTAIVNPMYGLPPYSFSWNTISSPNNNVFNLPAGLNICTTVDQNGCTRYDTITIGPSQALLGLVSKANANCDSSNGSITMSMINGVSPYTYSWNNGQSTSTISNLAPNQFYIFTATDNINCVFKDTIFIANDGKPYLDLISFSAPACHGDSTGTAEVQGYLGVSPYKYSIDGINFSTSVILNNMPGGLVTIYIKDANSCVNDTSINFIQPPLLLTSYTLVDTLACYNSIAPPITLTTSGGYPPYQYSINNLSYTNNNVLNGLTAGNYTVLIKDSVECIKKIQFEIVAPTDPLTIQFYKEDVPCFTKNQGSISVTASGGWPPYTYLWANGSSNSMLDSLAPGFYSVLTTDNNGCAVDAKLELKQLTCCVCTVPNAFSPNGDLLNDKLVLIPAGSNYTDFFFAIYNRQGQRVYESINVQDAWDGAFHGRNLPTETYYYYMQYKCNTEDNIILQKGDITLIR